MMWHRLHQLLQVAQLQEAQSKTAAELEALQAQQSSLQAAHVLLEDELREQQKQVAEARGAAHDAASEQAAYVQMVS